MLSTRNSRALVKAWRQTHPGRRTCLNEQLFGNLKEAREIIEEWRIDYNTRRPHSSLNGLTPTEFAARRDQGQNWNRLSL